jgi:hypothetical protein
VKNVSQKKGWLWLYCGYIRVIGEGLIRHC